MFGKLFAKTGPKPMDQAAFARHIGDHISRNFAQANQVRADAPNFELHITDPQGETQTIFLHNAYQHYLGAFEDGPEQVEAYLRDYLAALAEMDRGSPEHLAENLVPLLRHVGYNPEQKSWSAPFAGDLGVMLGFDSPHNLSYVMPADLEGLNLTPEAAIDLAFEQFDATAETAQMEQISGDGLMVLTLPDADWGCPTLMLYPDIFSNFLSQNGLERLLVTHPSRGAIFFTSADLEHAEDMMVETLRRGADDGHRQSQYVYSFTPDTGFVAHIYLPDDGPPEPAQARVLH